MNRQLLQVRLARIEGYRITRARLDEQFQNGIGGLDALEAAVADQLAANNSGLPWRTSETERASCSEGIRLAALEFFWDHYQILRFAGQCHSA